MILSSLILHCQLWTLFFQLFQYYPKIFEQEYDLSISLSYYDNAHEGVCLFLRHKVSSSYCFDQNKITIFQSTDDRAKNLLSTINIISLLF